MCGSQRLIRSVSPDIVEFGPVHSGSTYSRRVNFNETVNDRFAITRVDLGTLPATHLLTTTITDILIT